MAKRERVPPEEYWKLGIPTQFKPEHGVRMQSEDKKLALVDKYGVSIPPTPDLAFFNDVSDGLIGYLHMMHERLVGAADVDVSGEIGRYMKAVNRLNRLRVQLDAGTLTGIDKYDGISAERAAEIEASQRYALTLTLAQMRFVMDATKDYPLYREDKRGKRLDHWVTQTRTLTLGLADGLAELVALQVWKEKQTFDPTQEGLIGSYSRFIKDRA